MSLDQKIYLRELAIFSSIYVNSFILYSYMQNIRI